MTGAVEMAKCANLSQEIRYKYIVKINRYNLKGYRDHKLDYGRTKMQARSIMWVLDKIDLTCSTNILPRMQLLTLYYKQCCYSSFMNIIDIIYTQPQIERYCNKYSPTQIIP